MRYKFLTDDDGHWYCMSVEEADALEANIKRCEAIDDIDAREEALEDVWDSASIHCCGGGPESYTFTDPVDEE